MSLVEDGEPSGRYFLFMMWWGHYIARILPGLVFIVSGLVTWVLWFGKHGPHRGALDVTCMVLLGLFLTGLWANRRYHRRYLCLYCHHEEPWLNPLAAIDEQTAQGRRNRRKLRLVHRPRLYAFMEMGHTWTIFIALLLNKYLPWYGRAMLSVLVVAGGAMTFYAMISAYKHVRLKPWCPWCRRPGEDDPTVAPTPSPTGVVPSPA